MKLKKLSAALMLLALCLTFIPFSAFAADYAATAKIPVSTAVTGAAPEKAEQYTVTLKAVDADAPMPEEASLTITGADKAAFEIDYTVPGIYHYEVAQTAGTDTTGTYDNAVYQVTVSVINDEEGGLGTEVAVYVDGGDVKQDSITFTNDYRKLTDITVSKVWKGENKNQPKSVTVQLYDGSSKCGDEVTLSAENNWTYTWKDLTLQYDVTHSYTVQEVNVPENYAATYATDGTTTTITNTYNAPAQKLIQTGQLNWPIPVMAVIGMALVGCGIALSRKNREDA